MSNILFIAQNTYGLEEMLLSVQKDAAQKEVDVLVLAVGEEVKPVLRRNGASFIELNDFLSYEENLEIDRFARDCAEEWFKDPKFQGALEYRDVNLGCAIMNGFDEYITWLVKQYKVIKKLLTTKDIKEVVVFGSRNGVILKGEFNDIRDVIVSEVVKIFCQKKGISYKGISVEHVDSNKPTVPMRGKIKKATKEIVKRLMSVVMPVLCAGKSDEKKEKILISSSYMHVKEVMEELERSGKYSLSYLRKVFSAKQSLLFSLRGIKYKIFPDIKVSRVVVEEINTLWDAFQKVLDAENHFSFDGFSFDVFMKPRLEEIFKNTFTKIASEIDYFYDLLETDKVSLIIVEEDVCVFNKPLILVANNLGIKSIVFQHGFLCSAREFRRAWYPLNATKIAVWGPLTKDALLTYGIPKESIEVIGCTRLGETNHILEGSKSKTLRRLGLDPSYKTILYPDQGLLEEHLHIASGTSNATILTKYVSDIVRMVLDSKGTQLIIKAHPGLYARMMKMINDSDELRSLVGELKGQKRLSILDEYDILDLVDVADLLIYDSTTVGSYGIYFNKPVIHYTLMPTVKELIYFKHDPTYNVNTEAELRKAVARALDFPREREENRKKYIEEYYYDSMGSVPRAIQSIENMISGKE